MNILQIGILIFIVIETLNIITLYFAPGMKVSNGAGVFNAWHKAQSDEEMKSFVDYLTSWIAGAKLIFVLLGIVIVIFGNIQTQLAAAAAFVVSILSFFFRLYPAIKKMDSKDQITPKGYSKTLLLMIVGFIVVFLAIFIVGLIQYL